MWSTRMAVLCRTVHTLAQARRSTALGRLGRLGSARLGSARPLTGCRRPASCGGSAPGEWFRRMMRPRPDCDARKNSTMTLHCVSRCAMAAKNEAEKQQPAERAEAPAAEAAGPAVERRALARTVDRCKPLCDVGTPAPGTHSRARTGSA